MKKKSPYIPFYTTDFLGGTAGMTASTKGIYITLLCLMYEHEAPIATKWDALARRCGCTLPAFKRAIDDLEHDGKVEVTEQGIWSEKCEKHVTLRRERTSGARLAANERWKKTKQKQGQGDAGASLGGCQPEPEPELYNKDTNVSLCKTPPANEISQAVSRFNAAAEKAGWPKVQKLTPARSKQIRARLAEAGGIEGWEDALRKAFASDFCRGRTAKPWTGFGFDWLIKPSNFTKLMEGNYDNRASSGGKNGSGRPRSIAERMFGSDTGMDGGEDRNASEPLLSPQHAGSGRGGRDV